MELFYLVCVVAVPQTKLYFKCNGIFKMKGLLGIVFCLNEREEVVIEPAAYAFLCIFSRMSILRAPYCLYSFYHGKLSMLVL